MSQIQGKASPESLVMTRRTMTGRRTVANWYNAVVTMDVTQGFSWQENLVVIGTGPASHFSHFAWERSWKESAFGLQQLTANQCQPTLQEKAESEDKVWLRRKKHQIKASNRETQTLRRTATVKSTPKSTRRRALDIHLQCRRIIEFPGELLTNHWRSYHPHPGMGTVHD